MKCRPVIAPAGQAATQVPQPLHNASLTRATLASTMKLIAVYGHSVMQVLQAEHSASFTFAMAGEMVTSPRFSKPTTMDAAAPA